MNPQILSWPLDSGTSVPDRLDVPGSNIVLDLHGDPLASELSVVMEGNQFMVLPDLLEAFYRVVGREVEVFSVTLPPSAFRPLVEGRRLAVGNLLLSVRPHVVMGPPEFMSGLHALGLTGEPATFAWNRGVVLLVRAGNPKKVAGAGDLLRKDVRVAISNPFTEEGSHRTYLAALEHLPGLADRIRHEGVFSRRIHHREIPALISGGLADAAPVYFHFARCFKAWFPGLFDAVEFQEGRAVRGAYQVALHRDALGHDQALAWRRFLLSPEAGRIYGGHGFSGNQDGRPGGEHEPESPGRRRGGGP